MSKIPEPGTTLGGKYLVEQVLGVGGMGVVVAATHLQLDQKVALKFLLPEALANPEVVARFSREARAAAKIRGEHVARVIDVGAFDDGAPFMVMEYLEGHDLAKQLEQSGPLPIEDLSRYMLETCEALAEAHAAKIVHRDLKPSNLFLAQQPDKQAIIKVLDFGISKLEDKPTAGLTKTSALMGTAFYMSPEQLTTPKAVDHRSDIWALGVIMYELLTGKQPFEGESVPEIIASILQNQREPLGALRSDVPEGLVAAVDRCLMFKVGERFANVAELAAAIAPFASVDDRRSVAIIGRVLGERVSLPNPMPPSAVVRPAASTSVPSAIGMTQHSASELESASKNAPPQTSTAAIVAGAVTTHGLSTSVAGAPRPTKKPIALIVGAAVALAALVGVGVSMRSQPEAPAAAGGIVSAPTEPAPVATTDPPPKPADPAPAPLPALAPEPDDAPAASATKPDPIGRKPAAAVTAKLPAGKPVASAAAAITAPVTTTAAPATSAPSKNPLQMGIK